MCLSTPHLGPFIDAVSGGSEADLAARDAGRRAMFDNEKAAGELGGKPTQMQIEYQAATDKAQGLAHAQESQGFKDANGKLVATAPDATDQLIRDAVTGQVLRMSIGKTRRSTLMSGPQLDTTQPLGGRSLLGGAYGS